VGEAYDSESDVGNNKAEEDKNTLQCRKSLLFNDYNKEDDYGSNDDRVSKPASNAITVEDLQGLM